MDWGSGITYLGEATLKGTAVRFGVKDADRLEHVVVLGKKGAGRAGFLAQMALQDVVRGTGVVVIDAAGNLSELLVERLEPEARNRLVFLDPSDAEYPFSWNPLEDYRTLQNDVAVPLLSELLSALYRTPPSKLVAWAAGKMLALREETLLFLYECVAEREFRDRIIPPGSEERKELDALMAEDPEAVEEITHNGRYLAKDTLMRNIVGQVKSSFSFSQLPQGAIIVLDVSRIRMFPTRITPLVRLFAHAARALAEPKAPTALYLNECLRAFAREDIEQVFSGRNILGASSDTAMTPDDVKARDVVLSRAGTIIALPPNINDLPTLERLFFPFVSADDFQKLESPECALMLTIDGLRSRPFFAKTFPMPARQSISYQDVQVFSREKHATPRHVVDQYFRKRYAPPNAGKPREDAGSFSTAFRSIFAKNAQPPGAPGASSPRPPAQPPKETPKADANQKPKEISEEELRAMLFTPTETAD